MADSATPHKTTYAFEAEDLPGMRTIFLIGAVVYPMFWLLHHLVQHEQDPLWMRFVFSGVLLVGWAWMKTSRLAVRYMVLIGLFMVCLLSLHLVYLAWLNRLSPTYILGLMIVAFLIPPLGSYRPDTQRITIWYIVFMAAIAVPAALLVDNPQISRAFFLGALGTTYILGVVADRIRAQILTRLRVSEERHDIVAQVVNAGLWDWDLKKDRIYYSEGWHALVGCKPDRLRQDPEEWLGRIHPSEIDLVRQQIQAHLLGETDLLESEHRLRLEGDEYIWSQCKGLALRHQGGEAHRIVGSHTNVTQQKNAEEQLRHDALHDGLTGLPNRSLFIDRLQRSIERSKRHPEYLYAVIFLDLDRFKLINDSFGHVVGDRLLVALVQRLQSAIRSQDTIARFGGDEFAVLVEDIRHETDATRVAERILKLLSAPFTLGEAEMFTSASMGITLSANGRAEAEDIIRDADTAMYRAKAQGRSQFVMFDNGMHERAVSRLQLETELQHGFVRQEFLLHYQPIVSLHTGKTTGFEALLRWGHPTRGLRLPREFLHVLEETGLIIPLGEWILSEACRQLKAWQDQFPKAPQLTMSVNLSTKQFWNKNLLDYVKQVLQETHLQPSSLILEITEGVVMHDTQRAAELLKSINDLGVRTHLDDFGTGYASLTHLLQFDVHALKIDRSFVRQMDSPGKGSTIAETMLTLARNLRLGVIAEGLETETQLQGLRALSCEQAQGYYFARPLPTEDITELLTRDPHW